MISPKETGITGNSLLHFTISSLQLHKYCLLLRNATRRIRISKRAGIEKVKKAITDFRQTWKELESVYAETRFVSYPASYIPDRYFHLASQSEDLTWMIQPEKLYFGMIEKWLQNHALKSKNNTSI